MWTEDYHKDLQKENLLRLVKNGAFKFTDSFFPYTSGEIGPYFIQSIDITKDGADYNFAIFSLSGLVRNTLNEKDIDVVSGGESRDWDFSNPVAYHLEKPHAKLYKDPAKNSALGADMKGKRVVHVADLQNEGSSVRDSWHPQITAAGGKLVHAFFYVDRLEKGVGVMKELGVPSLAVVPLDRYAWEVLQAEKVVSPEVYKSLVARSENPEAWAHAMLRGNIGTLVKMLQDPQKASKAEKILLKGYPDLKDELADRMKQAGFEWKDPSKRCI